MLALDLKTLKDAVAGKYAAIRRVTRMEALGEKIFPPTYEGDEYATEQRNVLNREDRTVQTVETVLLDNVDIYAKQGGGWTCKLDEAQTGADGQPVKSKLTKTNHGNVTPSLIHEDKETKKWVPNHGGVTVACAEQQTELLGIELGGVYPPHEKGHA